MLDISPCVRNTREEERLDIEPEDVANLGVFLAIDEARYITGQQIRIDAGALIKFPEGPTKQSA